MLSPLWSQYTLSVGAYAYYPLSRIVQIQVEDNNAKRPVPYVFDSGTSTVPRGKGNGFIRIVQIIPPKNAARSCFIAVCPSNRANGVRGGGGALVKQKHSDYRVIAMLLRCNRYAFTG